MNSSERFLMVLDYIIKKKESRIRGYKDMSEILGCSPSMLSDVKSGRSKIGMKLLESLITNFQYVNANWILTGKGDMIISSKNKVSIDDFISNTIEECEKYRKILKEINLLSKI